MESLSRNATYRVTVHTSDENHAGTNANISIILYGSGGARSDKTYLDIIGYNDFEQGDTDDYTVRTASALGEITKIVVQNDGAGSASDWELGWIKVQDVTNLDEPVYNFPYNKVIGTTTVTIYNDA